MKKRLTLIALGALTLPSFALADVVEGDWRLHYDSDLIVDQSHQRVFLDLTYTKGLSVDQTIDLINTELQGWRLATQQEVGELYTSLTQLPHTDDVSSQGTAMTSRQDLTRIFGVTDSYRTFYNEIRESSKGLYLGDDGWVYALDVMEQSEYYISYHYARGNSSKQFSEYGVFLTPDENNLTLFQQNNVEYNTISDVSAPAALSALLFSLMGITRRKTPSTTRIVS